MIRNEYIDDSKSVSYGSVLVVPNLPPAITPSMVHTKSNDGKSWSQICRQNVVWNT